MAGTVQALLNQAGDIVARMSNVVETLQRDLAKWEEVAPELDAAFDRVQKATAEITELEAEISILEEKKTTLQNTLSELKQKFG